VSEEGPIGPTSPTLAPTRAPREVLELYILSKPGGAYDDDVRYIVGLYYETAPPVGVDPFLIGVQMCHETDELSSHWSQEPHRNPAGIGVTGTPGAGVSFPDWPSAVRAHLGRILAYALTDAEANTVQRALIDEGLGWRPLPERYRGIAPVLGALTGRWAADELYDKRIADIANSLLTARRPPPPAETSRGSATGSRASRPRPR
jgi:hypothetical protein